MLQELGNFLSVTLTVGYTGLTTTYGPRLTFLGGTSDLAVIQGSVLGSSCVFEG